MALRDPNGSIQAIAPAENIQWLPDAHGTISLESIANIAWADRLPADWPQELRRAIAKTRLDEMAAWFERDPARAKDRDFAPDIAAWRRVLEE